MIGSWKRAMLAGVALLIGTVPAACGGHGSPTTPVTPAPTTQALELVRSVALSIPEPSDMCLDRDGVHWWTVSDNTCLVYKLRLSDCAVVGTLSYHGSDLEGIWQDPGDGTLYVTEERTREIVHLDTTGVVLGRVTVAGLGGDANSGLEGITSGPVTGQFFVLQEKQPARIVVVDTTGQVMSLHSVTWVLDLSGATHDPRTGQLVVVSDQSRKVCWVDVGGEVVSSWDTAVNKGEGVAIDTTRGRLYVVSDKENAFYEFRLPGPGGS
jgi:uncharacterized protein YjiK